MHSSIWAWLARKPQSATPADYPSFPVGYLRFRETYCCFFVTSVAWPAGVRDQPPRAASYAPGHPGMANMTDGNLSAIPAEQGPPTTTIAEYGQYEGRTSPKRLARIAGFLYLLVAIFSAFAYFMEKKVYVSGDAATTTRNVIAHSGLVRTAVVADLLQATIWVFLAMTLYVLLKHVNKNAASAMVVFAAVGAGITLLNEVFEFEGLRTATGAVHLAAGTTGRNAQVLLLLDTQHYGFFIAQIFFGLWLVPLGYLAYKSQMFPDALGVLLVIGGACYLAGTLAAFLIPGSGQNVNTFITIPSAIAEICMVVYLLVIGVKTPEPDERIPAPGLISSGDKSRSQ